jgi:hypothetical protein
MGKDSGGKQRRSDGLAVGDHGLGTVIDALLGSAPESLEKLTPMEQRLVHISTNLLHQVLVQLRVDIEIGSLRPLTGEMMANAAKLSLSAAVAMDDDLRKLREGLKARQ